MKLIVEPEDGVTPILSAIQKAKKTVDVMIFRFDRPELEKALQAAVKRGVVVRTLIAHTNSKGEKNLRKLELRLLDYGVTVARTASDLLRYHGKFLVVDRATLYVLGFNYTRLDIDRSRSFGVVTKNRKLVQEALRLFEADCIRQPYTAGFDLFVVSPVNARERLMAFIRKARKQLLVYDPKVAAQIEGGNPKIGDTGVYYICPVQGAREQLVSTQPAIAKNTLIFPTKKMLDSVHIFDSNALNNQKYLTAWQNLISG